jgi:hypothetical protein
LTDVHGHVIHDILAGEAPGNALHRVTKEARGARSFRNRVLDEPRRNSLQFR